MLHQSLWLVLGLSLFPSSLLALTKESDQAALCDQAALAAAADFGIPEQVMLAITRVETGVRHQGNLRPWPWTVNHAGSGHWFPDLASALAFVGPEVEVGTTNMDIGCFQLNLRWHAKAFSSLEEMFDPLANARYAARFLTDLYARKGTWDDAVAAYHSETPEHAQAYLSRIEGVLAELDTAALAPPSHAGEFASKSANRFPLLQPGIGGTLASLVPDLGPTRPLIGTGP